MSKKAKPRKNHLTVFTLDDVTIKLAERRLRGFIPHVKNICKDSGGNFLQTLMTSCYVQGLRDGAEAERAPE